VEFLLVPVLLVLPYYMVNKDEYYIAFYFLSCILGLLFCCTVHHCLFSFLIFSLLATSSIKLNLNLNLY